MTHERISPTAWLVAYLRTVRWSFRESPPRKRADLSPFAPPNIVQIRVVSNRHVNQLVWRLRHAGTTATVAACDHCL